MGRRVRMRRLALERLEARLLLDGVADFGDAPYSFYQTLLVDRGANHTIVEGVHLGALVDGEPDGLPVLTADGDDLDGAVDDEDGVVFLEPWARGLDVDIEVTASVDGLLSAWVDWTRDGDWVDTDEQVFADAPLTAGVNQLSISVPVDAAMGDTYVRFRFSTAGGLPWYQGAPDGEVEDYLVSISTAASVSGAVFRDGDLSGDRSEGEAGLPGRTVFMDGDSDGELDDGEAFATTDEAGDYTFPDLAAGSWTVTLVALSGWVLTAPDGAGTHEVELELGERILGADFGVFLPDADYGDAPDPTYPTLWASGGALHAIDPALYLGLGLDSESDGQPSPAADGDGSDEDGVVFLTGMTAGADAPVEVTASLSGLLNAWIDFNADGDWDDAGEQVAVDAALASGQNALTIVVPADAVEGETFARFRFNSAGGLLPTGAALDGEVEDYAVSVVLPGSVTGTVFNDADDDGAKDAEEPGLADWTVFLDADGDGVWDDGEVSVLTDVDGAYAFAGLSPATYDVVSVVPIEWRATEPAGGVQTIVLASGDVVADADFGNHVLEWDFGDARQPFFPTRLSADGARHQVWPDFHLGATIDSEPDGLESDDADGDDLDGVDDEDGVVFGEELLAAASAHVTVTASAPGLLSAWIDYNQDRTWNDAGEQVLTDVPLIAGVNELEISIPQSARKGETTARFRFSSAGGLSYDGPADDGEVEDYAVEIVWPGAIAGHKFLDTNDNAVWDVLEPGLPDWTIYLDANDNAVLDAGEYSTTTDADGYYAFPGIEPGSYTVREALPDNWTQTTPGGGGGHAVTLAFGQIITGLDFGNRLTYRTVAQFGAAPGPVVTVLDMDQNADVEEDDITVSFGWGGRINYIFIGQPAGGSFDGVGLVISGSSGVGLIYDMRPGGGDTAFIACDAPITTMILGGELTGANINALEVGGMSLPGDLDEDGDTDDDTGLYCTDYVTFAMTGGAITGDIVVEGADVAERSIGVLLGRSGGLHADMRLGRSLSVIQLLGGGASGRWDIVGAVNVAIVQGSVTDADITLGDRLGYLGVQGQWRDSSLTAESLGVVSVQGGITAGAPGVHEIHSSLGSFVLLSGFDLYLPGFYGQPTEFNVNGVRVWVG
jgi:GEVED domain-containing protein/SdrD B-like protein